MAEVRPIRTEADYAAALARVDELMDAEVGSQEGDELDILVELVEAYESKHEPMGFPGPLAAIEFRMEQAGLTTRDLVPLIGSRSKVSEVLSGQRSITMPMARALHEHLGVPAEVLLQASGPDADQPEERIQWSRFPLREMTKRGWVPSVPNMAKHAEDLIQGLIDRAGGWQVARAALYRKNDHLRMNAKTDPYAQQAWCWQVLATANANLPDALYKTGTVTLDFLTQVAKLSCAEEGPRVAQRFLAQHGIPLVIERHLPRTYLDGAALRLGDGRPVVALTLRYDRIDSFWFSLLHELAHVGRHLDRDAGDAFIDDLSLRKPDPGPEDRREADADEWAAEALIPSAKWEASPVRSTPTPIGVMTLAHHLQVHPATVAGRIRHERQNYRLLSQFVGTGKVRQQFGLDDPLIEQVSVRNPNAISRD